MKILSLGAGVQSSTLALMAKHGEIDIPDCAIFADTQSEPDSVYLWLDWLEKELSYPVYRVTKGNLAEKSLVVRTSKIGTQYQKHSPPCWIQDIDGRVGILNRQCTTDFKIVPIIQKIKATVGKKPVEQFIGISIDEAHRMKPSREKWITNRWPLVEKRMSRRDCLNWMERNGYPTPPRSSCWFCPYHSNTEWKRLQKEEPIEFAKAIKYENDFQNTMSQVKGFRGKPFLHRSCIPLGEINFNEESPQADMFGNECEGLCGV